jgi:hypothetical protein
MPSVQVKDASGSTQTVQTLPAVGQSTGANSLPVVLASDQSAVPVAPALATSGGWKPKLLNGLTNAAVTIKASAGQLAMLEGYNPNAAQIYIQVFDSASPTVGTTTPVLSIPIAAGGTGGFTLSLAGVQFANAITVAATTTATGSTAPGTTLDCNAAYN